MKNKFFAALVGLLSLSFLAVPSRSAQYNFTPDAVTTQANISPTGVAIGKGKTAASAGILDVTGNANLSGNLTVGGALVLGSTVTGTSPLVVSSATIGVGATISTFTSTGNASIAGILAVAGASNLTGALTVSGGAIAATGGPIQPRARTKAQLGAITPAAGDVYSCSDCTNTYDLVVGTGATVNGFREVGTSHGAQ